MFEALTGKLTAVFERLGKRGRLTEADVEGALREVRMALLEADVNFRVARNLVSSIRERTLQGEVLTSLNPGQQVVKITNEELISLLEAGSRSLLQGPRPPSAILVVGLNGSGKTTTSAKLARHLRQTGQKPMLIAADLQRPAAIDQLRTLAGRAEVELYESGTSTPLVDLVNDGMKRAAALGSVWAIVDTAGRFQVDDDLMNELKEVKDAASPSETLLVVDAMTGQDAVRAAEEFHARIGLTGLVLTKLDGDARGGAALSISAVTGVPTKFIATGERLEALEPFHPDRMASRILGMGDMLTLIEKASTTFDQEEARRLEKKMRQVTFDLEDFLGQLQQLRNMGPLSQVLEMVPGMSKLKTQLPSDELDEGRLSRIEAIIRSMTPQERQRPEIIGGSRRKRIARGSGATPQEVNQLLGQFRQAQKMMRQMTSGKGMGGRRRAKGMLRL